MKKEKEQKKFSFFPFKRFHFIDSFHRHQQNTRQSIDRSVSTFSFQLIRCCQGFHRRYFSTFTFVLQYFSFHRIRFVFNKEFFNRFLFAFSNRCRFTQIYGTSITDSSDSSREDFVQIRLWIDRCRRHNRSVSNPSTIRFITSLHHHLIKQYPLIINSPCRVKSETSLR